MRHLVTLLPCLLVFMAIGAAPPGTAPAPPASRPSSGRLAGVRSYAIQIQGFDRRRAIDELAESTYDCLIIDALHLAKGGEQVDMPALLRRLRAKIPNRLILAYLDLTQAESDRIYWKSSWSAPATGQVGSPPFLLTQNQSGWDDTYPVAYWDPQWRGLILGDAMLPSITRAGFDGVVLDGIDTHTLPMIRAAAARQHVDPDEEMRSLLTDAASKLRSASPNSVVITLGAAALIAGHPDLQKLIDAVIIEGAFSRGHGDVPWNSPEAGDLPPPPSGPQSTEAQVRSASACHNQGLPIFTLDYTHDPASADKIRRLAVANGFIPFITRSPLSQLPR